MEENFTDYVSVVLKYQPVKVLLRPMSVDSRNGNNIPLVTDKKIRRAVKKDEKIIVTIGGENKEVNKPDQLDGIDSRSLRLFEVSATGIRYNNGDTSAITISSQATSAANETNRNTMFTFYNSTMRDTIPKYNTPYGIQYFFNQYQPDNGLVGFTANMNATEFRTFYEDMTTKPTYFTVVFKASDSKGNSADTYIYTGTSPYTTNGQINTDEYFYEIVFDPSDEKYYDLNYVEIRESQE